MPTTAVVPPPSTKPLLSICVPTYNRAHLLRIMLQAALPQVKQCGDLVELCVCDNASPDNTPEVVEASRDLGPFHYARNTTNLGAAGNYVRLSTELARGKFVWLLGDDDLLLPGAVHRVVQILEANSSIDVFYTNFRWAKFEEHWPQHALGGFEGEFTHLHVPVSPDRRFRFWKELINHETHLCTQMFAHIVQRQIWVKYWRTDRNCMAIDGHKLTLASIFPHNLMLADTCMHAECFFIGTPVTTCFLGAQCTGHAKEIWGLFYLQLLRHYHKKGLAGAQLQECLEGVLSHSHPLLLSLLADNTRSPAAAALSFLRGGWRYRAAWKCLVQAVHLAGKPWLLDQVFKSLAKVNKVLHFTDVWHTENPPMPYADSVPNKKRGRGSQLIVRD